MSMYEGSVRVPLVISGPGFAKNATISSLVSFGRVNLEKLQVLKYILRLRDLKLYIFSFFDLVEKTLFSLIDVYPTIMNAANIQTETVLDGASLLQVLKITY